jgi:large subunit ribosomal protein L21e
MPSSRGYRGGTRHLFSRGFRRHGAPNLTTYLTKYTKGDFVDIVVNGACHKGMPYKVYHGRTGRVFNVNPNSIGVVLNKRIRTRIEPKRVHVRVEHLRQSTCQVNFKNKVKAVELEKRSKQPKKNRKRVTVGPKEEFVVVPNKDLVVFQNPSFHKEIC